MMPDGHEYEAWVKEQLLKEQQGKDVDDADSL